MDGEHHQRNGPELEQTLGDTEHREACQAIVHRVAKSGHDLEIERLLYKVKESVSRSVMSESV